MDELLFFMLCVVIFTLAGIGYWRFVRILTALFQLFAYLLGFGVANSLREDEGLVTALLAGTAVYLVFYSMILIVKRLATLEVEVVKLGGKPNTPDLFEFIWRQLNKNRAKAKN